MKDPLTQREHTLLLSEFRRAYFELYNKALRSGALADDEFGKGDHRLAKFILLRTAQEFKPLQKEAWQKNLTHFV